jgi:hypothetical protein
MAVEDKMKKKFDNYYHLQVWQLDTAGTSANIIYVGGSGRHECVYVWI